jgi:outer membrane protein assembly factor BamB
VEDPERPGLTAALTSSGDVGAKLNPADPQLMPLDPTNGSASIELWFRPDTRSGGPQLLASFGASAIGASLTLDDDVLRFQVRRSNVRAGIDNPPGGGLDDGLEDLVGVVKARLTDIGRFIHVVAAIETGGVDPTMTLYVDGDTAAPLTDSGTGLFKDESLTGVGTQFHQVTGSAGQNPLSTRTKTVTPVVADIAIDDWSGPWQGGLLRNPAVGGSAGPLGGPLDLGAFRHRSLQGQLAVINVYSRALDPRQVGVLYRQVVEDLASEPTPHALAGLILDYDAASGHLSGGEDWENRHPVDLSADMPSDALDWKFARTDGANVVPVADSVYPGIRSAYRFSRPTVNDDGVLSARRSDGTLADSVPEILANGADRRDASFEIWFKPLDHFGKEVLFETGGAVDGVSLRLNGDTLELAVRHGNNPDAASRDGLIRAPLGHPAGGEFVQAVGVLDLDEDEIRLYVDGVRRAQAPFFGADWAGGDPAGLGAPRGSVGGAQGSGYGGFDGEISIVRLYGRALSDADARANFNAVVGDVSFSEPWCCFRKDASHQAHNRAETILSPSSVRSMEARWLFQTDSIVMFSSPAVVDGVLYIASFDQGAHAPNGQGGFLHAVDAASGTEKWRRRLTDERYSFLRASPAVEGGRVYIGDYSGRIYAVDAATGETLWTHRTSGEIRSSAAVFAGSVFVGSYDGGLYALNAEDGARQWLFQTGAKIFSSPAVAAGTVYVGSTDGALYAVDAITGKQRWRFPTGNQVRSSPALADGTVYVGSMNGKVYALAAGSGAQRWTFATAGSVHGSPAVAYGNVYVGSYDGAVYAIDAASGAKQWSFQTAGEIRSSPVIANGVVYVGSHDRSVYALDASSGARLWSYRASIVNHPQPPLADWSFPQGWPVVASSPAVSGGMLYTSFYYGAVRAFGLPAR